MILFSWDRPTELPSAIGSRLRPPLTQVNNFYSPLRALFETAVSAGFIKAENLFLVKIIDLPNGGNTDASRAAEWGQAAVDALREWALPVSSGPAVDRERFLPLQEVDVALVLSARRRFL